jgi:hypothetical protein
MRAVLDNGEIPTLGRELDSININGELWCLFSRCWDRNPSKRPTAVEALKIIQGIVASRTTHLGSVPETRDTSSESEETEVMLSLGPLRASLSPSLTQDLNASPGNLLPSNLDNILPIIEQLMEPSFALYQDPAIQIGDFLLEILQWFLIIIYGLLPVHGVLGMVARTQMVFIFGS